MRAPASLAPLQTLLATKRGSLIPLPPRLTRLYGVFRMEQPRSGPRVFSNLVSTLDGVVSLKIKGHDGGGDISGFSAEDRMVMGLLRTMADVVIVGGGSIGTDSGRMWTAGAICPELAPDYRRLSMSLRNGRAALNVAVSASGHLNLRSAAFTTGGPLLVVTSRAGAKHLSRHALPDFVEIRAIAGRRKALSATDILDAVCQLVSPERILIEGGPRLLGSFYAARLVNEQFLTLAPQLAGRNPDDGRPGLVMGQQFAPQDPRWGTLADVRRSGSHLFLRYSFDPRRGRRVPPAR